MDGVAWAIVGLLVAVGLGLLGFLGWTRWRALRKRQLADSAAFRPRETAPEPVTSPTWMLEQAIERQQHDIDALKNSLRVLTEEVRGLRTQIVAQRSPRPAEAPGAPTPSLRLSKTTAPEQLLADYRAAADDLPAEGDRFIETWKPRAVAKAVDGAGFRLDGDARDAFLWAIGEGSDVLLLPGYKALKSWRTHFAGARESSARDWFAAAFDLDPASTRFEATPATAYVDADRVTVRRRGRITGFRG